VISHALNLQQSAVNAASASLVRDPAIRRLGSAAGRRRFVDSRGSRRDAYLTRCVPFAARWLIPWRCLMAHARLLLAGPVLLAVLLSAISALAVPCYVDSQAGNESNVSHPQKA
jgi:hypothetical protein